MFPSAHKCYVYTMLWYKCAITLCLEINVLILILKYVLLKNANHLYLQQDIIFCNSNINENWPQITKTYIIMMEKFEILGEVPNMTQRQFSSVAQLCPTLCNPMNHSMPDLPVHHQLPEFIQTHVHWVSDAIQPSHPLSSPSPPAPNPSQHQSLFQWVSSSHEVAKELEFQP